MVSVHDPQTLGDFETTRKVFKDQVSRWSLTDVLLRAQQSRPWRSGGMSSRDPAGPLSAKESDLVVVAHPEATIDVEAITRGRTAEVRRRGTLPSPRARGSMSHLWDQWGMSEEHLPPRTVQYRRRMQGIELRDWFSKPNLDVPARGRVVQGGLSGTCCVGAATTRPADVRRYRMAGGAAQVVRALGHTPEEMTVRMHTLM